MNENSGSVARLDMLALLLRHVSNQQLFMVITFRKRIAVDRLKTALARLHVHHPLLACKLSVNGGGSGRPGWVQRNDRKPASIPVHVVDGKSMKETAADYCAAYPATHEGLELSVLRGARSDALCIKVDHALADAAGTKIIAYELASLYAHGNSLGNQACSDSVSRSLADIASNLGIRTRLAGICHAGNKAGCWQFPRGKSYMPRQPYHAVLDLGPNSVGRIKAGCSPLRATVNDALVNSAFHAIAAALDCSPGTALPIHFTVDLRCYLPAGRQARIANLSGAGQVCLSTARDNGTTPGLMRAHSALRKAKKQHQGLGSALAIDMLLRARFTLIDSLMQRVFSKSIDSARTNPMLTNFGEIDSGLLDFGRAEVKDALLLGPSLWMPGLNICASSFRGRMTLNCGGDARMTSPQLTAAVLENMSERLLPCSKQPVNRQRLVNLYTRIHTPDLLRPLRQEDSSADRSPD